MATCPNINLDSWKSLVSSRGEDIAYYLWDKYEGVVPKNEYEVSIKPGVEELFDSNPELANQVYEVLGLLDKTQRYKNQIIDLMNISNEQKQQALQLYSQYLDTIFPDSKVKDIVYHGVTKGREAYNNILQNGFLTTNKSNWSNNKDKEFKGVFFTDLSTATSYGVNLEREIRPEEKDFVIPAIVNVETLLTPKMGLVSGTVTKLRNENSDIKNLGIQGEEGSEGVHENTVVFEPEQIHILGGKQDIEGFKNFVGGKTNVQYQLTSKEIKEADKKLDAKLLNFLSRYGVKSTEINNFKERFGVDAIGATDVLNKIIYHSVEKKLDTIPEEAAHMIVMLMGQTHPLIKDLMDNIKDWSGYQAVYDEYMPVYNNEKQVKVEALGKLVTESLLQKWTGKSKEERNLLTKILEAVTDFLNALTKPFVLKEGSYFKDAADKIAVNVLQENEAFIGSPKSKIERLNYEQALSGNKLAQNIINTYSGKRFGFKLVGSLAIAGQGEDIYRPSKAPIHDLDFIVENDDKETGLEKYNRLVDHMNQINAVPIHGGWENKQKEYTTYAYLIPKQGYKFSNIERNERDNLYKYTILDENDNVVANVKLVSPKVTVFTDKNGKVLSEEKINSLSQLHIPVDFFVYNVDSNKQSVDIFSSIQDIYFGKLSLSPLGTDERMFQREKDQEDYRTSNFNKRDIQKNEFIYFQLPKNKSIGKEDNLQYQFKVVDKISNNLDKINKLFKQIGNNNTFWNKIQQDFQIPKDQIELLKNSEGNTIEEKLTSFVADYSYTVEINLSIDPKSNQNYGESIEQGFRRGQFKYWRNYNFEYIKKGFGKNDAQIKISKEEYEQAFNSLKNKPTDIYGPEGHKLIVPGGVNYTENAIRIPGVINVISSNGGYHDNEFNYSRGDMTGWFRSDDKGVTKIERRDLGTFNVGNDIYTQEFDAEKIETTYYKNNNLISKEEYTKANLKQPEFKTRRILELQSFFQKTRDKNLLISEAINKPGRNTGSQIENEEEFLTGGYYYYNYTGSHEDGSYKEEYSKLTFNDRLDRNWKNKINISKEEYEKVKKEYETTGYYTKDSKNQFLQLLNKDNNWVTFFVKSIIQDSAKKGYEKVLFPTGNTASKVEGHTTLEEFKKQKEDRIKEIDDKIDTVTENYLGFWSIPNDYNANGTLKQFNTKKEAIEGLLREKNQLKQELERVEGPEGFGALKPIYNFYENTVANVLKKQGFNPTIITDEYGNTWNEVTLTEQNKEEIYLQQEPQSTKKADEEINTLVKNFLAKLGISVKSVDEIRDKDGNVISATAKADMLNKIIEIIEGKAGIDTLPEEAAHFFVEMLDENNPLLKEMMSKITGYKIYAETVEQYKNNSQYRNKDGTLNITKLKKEAIGKLIAQHIVSQSTTNESDAKMKDFTSWWSKVWNFIKSLFKKSQVDAFKVAAEKILKSDTSDLSQQNIQDQGEFYQLEGIEKLEQHQTDIQLDNSIDPKTGQKRHIYNINGKDIKYSVTSKYVDAWLKRKFPNDNRSETQKKIDLLKADYGDIIHEMMQDIIDVYVDPKTHMVRNIPAASKNKNVDTKPYELFDKYIKDLIDNFNAPGTKFMREVKIYDPVKDVAGSIDLLIIEPNGTAHIYDWKSQEIAREQTELKPYKETMYRIQLQEYKKILQTHYDIKNFGYVRAIPIRVVYGYTGKGDTRTIDGVNKIEMGSFDLSDIPEHKNYLLPITLRDEKSDDKELSEYIKKLNSVMDILENKKYKTEDERRRKKVELSKYKNAVRDLQLKGDIRKFIELGNYEINKYKKMIKDETLTEKDALESLEILRVFTNTTNIFNNYMNELKKLKKETKEQELKDAIDELINDYNQMNSSADIVLESMHEAIKNIAVKFSKEKANIDNLLDAETEISKLTGMFSSLSTIPQKAFRVFSRILGDSQNKRDNQFKKDFEELSKLKDEYIDWARSQGYSNKDLFKPLLDYDGDNWTGKFLKKYRSEFYKKMQVAIQSEDIKWLIDNTEFNQEKFNKDKERQKEFYSTLVFDTKDKNNNEKLQQQAYDNWLLKHDVNIGGIHMNKEAYLNMDNYNGKKVLNSYLKPKATWYTEQWKKLESSPAALKTYNYFQDLLKRSNKAGVIDEYSPAFIPNISRNKLEQFVFGGDMFSSKGIFEKLEVESGESPFAPQINPITGAIEHSIPTHFVRDIGVEKEDGTMDYSQKSVDLFRVFGIWAAQLANYESMSEIEDKARLLLFVEKNKSHIETNQFNKPVLEGGIKKEIPGNEINSQLLSDFINYYFYNIQSGKIEDKVIKLGDKEYSSHKVLGWLTRFFSLKTLALNPLSGTANFVGGTGNAFFQASKGILFNTSDWASSIYDVTRRNEIALGLLGAADALLEDKTQGMINKLSVSSVIAANTIDKAYVMMHTSDKAVQYPIAIALMKNHMVDENGKIVDIKTYVKAKYKYNESFYSLPTSEQTIIRKKIEDEVTTLKETKSIYTTAKIVNDKIEIPGVDLQSEQWGRFRLKIKKVSKNVLGNSTRDDINSIRTGMLGSMAMQFRSWMPQMVQERFGKLKYDQDLEVHTMGKFNLFFQEMFTKRSVALLTAIVNASGTSMIEAAKQKYLLLKAEAIEKGEEFTITEGEFVDMYIGNIRSLYKEFLMILGIGALMFTMLSGDDDDDENKGWRAYAARAFRKYYDEFAFFYFPTSWSNLVNTPIPAVGLAEDFFRFTGALTKQGYGFVTNDDDKMDDAKPAKYFSKMMPLFKEGIQIRAIFDDDFRKDWDIRFNTTNR